MKKNIDTFLLTETVTVGQARDWMRKKDSPSKNSLVKLIYDRFSSRYVKHLHGIDSGFLKMAVACLMIETLESFRQGKKDTKGKSEKMFKDFFATEEQLFPGFHDIASNFYSSIRCGILHQAESTNAWRILRKDDLLDKTNRTINATKFIKALEKSLNNYVDKLKTSKFNSTIWKNALRKIENICDNCKASP